MKVFANKLPPLSEFGKSLNILEILSNWNWLCLSCFEMIVFNSIRDSLSFGASVFDFFWSNYSFLETGSSFIS